MIGEVLALAGALLTLLAAIGVVRFRDVLERMHAVTKASTVGLLFVLAGTAFAVPAGDITTLVLAGLSQMVTMPVGAFLIGRATYRAEGIEARVDVVDGRDDAGRRLPHRPGHLPGRGHRATRGRRRRAGRRRGRREGGTTDDRAMTRRVVRVLCKGGGEPEPSRAGDAEAWVSSPRSIAVRRPGA